MIIDKYTIIRCRLNPIISDNRGSTVYYKMANCNTMLQFNKVLMKIHKIIIIIFLDFKLRKFVLFFFFIHTKLYTVIICFITFFRKLIPNSLLIISSEAFKSRVECTVKNSSKRNVLLKLKALMLFLNSIESTSLNDF